ncbi:unnamed protein product [Rotaria sordida]|uniref:Cell wall hydrolase SleB domain-containing protein n=1 Tax=Rotaria sordida TaxID=392033 RepID=A0A813ZRL1_9BILA|nr:unnamed protein product [Rotaria sordida]CAF3817090.1 unnamed protein product [Rotaria sordida]
MSGLSDREVLAKTIYGEARGESREGQEAVGHVIKNRAQANKSDWGGNSISGVCLQHKQFECWNGRGDIEIKEQDAYEQCLQVADSILNGSSQDPTRGADHYNNPNKEPNAEWPEKCTVLGDVGQHRFYKGPN